MMKKTWIKTAGLIMLAALMTTALDAQPGFRGRQGAGQGRGLGPCGQGYGPGQSYGPGQGFGQAGTQHYGRGFGTVAALDLTEEQQEQIQSLRLEHYKEMKPLRNQMAELKARERTLMSAEEVDMKAVNSVIDDQTELMNQMRKQQAEHRVNMREILTDEQLMKLEQRGNFRGRHGRGMRNCPYGTGPGTA